MLQTPAVIGGLVGGIALISMAVGVLVYRYRRTRRANTDKVFKAASGSAAAAMTDLKASESFAFRNYMHKPSSAAAGSSTAGVTTTSRHDVVVEEDDVVPSLGVPASSSACHGDHDGSTKGNLKSSTRFALSPVRSALGKTKFVPQLHRVRLDAAEGVAAQAALPGAVSSRLTDAQFSMGGSVRGLTANPLATPRREAAAACVSPSASQCPSSESPMAASGLESASESPLPLPLPLPMSPRTRSPMAAVPVMSLPPVSPLSGGGSSAESSPLSGSGRSPTTPSGSSALVQSMMMGRVYSGKASAGSRGGSGVEKSVSAL